MRAGEEDLKRTAAERVVEEYVASGMVVGLGPGSTASHAVWKIGELIENGSLSGTQGVPNSTRIAAIPVK